MGKHIKEIGIYIHIPFCSSKCYYCDFRSESGNDEEQKKYVKMLIDELQMYKLDLESRVVSTVFIGGGTPSILKAELIAEIMKYIKSNYRLKTECEITIECNPGTLSIDKLTTYKNSGINRLSIGLQTYNDKELKSIGRIHNIKEFEESITNAKVVGFKSINVDIIYGLPNQSIESLRKTVNRVIELDIDHVSAYSLKIEEGTRFYSMYEKNEIDTVSDEEDREMYYLVRELLKNNGINQYEISNFAKENHESRHNKIYWLNREYLGIGLAAHSFFNNERYSNYTNFNEYYKSIELNSKPIDIIEKKTKEDLIVESIFLGLRLVEGINISEINTRFNISIEDLYKDKIEKLEKKGLIERRQGFIRLTSYGMDVSNSVFIEFL